jgi:hypothetical protein
MSTSESYANSERCPNCGSPMTVDRKRRGFVRHKERRTVNGKVCTYGRRGRDRDA